jgi:ribonuclease HI
VQVVVHVDGGARGNPGPAAAAAVVSTPDGQVLDEAAITLGRATNNVAEYRALLLGLERAAALGASQVDVVNDSELIAKQVDGSYRVKNADLQPLHQQAKQALAGFERWSIRSVPRAQNAAADALVNRALDGDEIAPNPATVAADGTDELLRDVARRALEPWLELILHELAAARDELAEGRPQAAEPRLRRVVAVERLLLDQLSVLEKIGADGVLEPRSQQLRAIERLSGGHGARPAGTSLYEAFGAGLGLPEEREERTGALAGLHRAGDPAWRAVAELLLEHDDAMARLRRDERRFFPELWDVRRAR